MKYRIIEEIKNNTKIYFIECRKNIFYKWKPLYINTLNINKINNKQYITPLDFNFIHTYNSIEEARFVINKFEDLEEYKNILIHKCFIIDNNGSILNMNLCFVNINHNYILDSKENIKSKIDKYINDKKIRVNVIEYINK